MRSSARTGDGLSWPALLGAWRRHPHWSHEHPQRTVCCARRGAAGTQGAADTSAHQRMARRCGLRGSRRRVTSGCCSIHVPSWLSCVAGARSRRTGSGNSPTFLLSVSRLLDCVAAGDRHPASGSWHARGRQMAFGQASRNEVRPSVRRPVLHFTGQSRAKSPPNRPPGGKTTDGGLA